MRKSCQYAPKFCFSVPIQISSRPAEKVSNEESIMMGYQFKPHSEATATVGSTVFALITQQDGAWTSGPAQEAMLVGTIIWRLDDFSPSPPRFATLRPPERSAGGTWGGAPSPWAAGMGSNLPKRTGGPGKGNAGPLPSQPRT
jgi:hypothetical protein